MFSMWKKLRIDITISPREMYKPSLNACIPKFMFSSLLRKYISIRYVTIVTREPIIDVKRNVKIEMFSHIYWPFSLIG